MSTQNFADRLHDAIVARQSRVVIGLDPDFSKLPPALREKAQELPGPEGELEAISAFCRGIINATADIAVAYKPQVAFFERYGAAGYGVLQDLLVSHNEYLLIVDCKRGDIGTTSEAYAKAYFKLEGEPEPPLPCYAVTHNPYLGHDSIAPYEKYLAADRGMFLLAKTSNPSSAEFQDRLIDDVPLCDHVAAAVERWGEPFRGDYGYSSLGLVVGATFPETAARIRALAPHAPILVPGLETQGGKLTDAHHFADEKGLGAVFNFSRAVIYAYASGQFASSGDSSDFANCSRAAAEHYRRELNASLGV
jgi:orotidine-5'-phosphate decarboxylase